MKNQTIDNDEAMLGLGSYLVLVLIFVLIVDEQLHRAFKVFAET